MGLLINFACLPAYRKTKNTVGFPNYFNKVEVVMKRIYKLPIRDGVKGKAPLQNKRGYILLKGFVRISNKNVSPENIICLSCFFFSSGPLCRFFYLNRVFWGIVFVTIFAFREVNIFGLYLWESFIRFRITFEWIDLDKLKN